MTEAMPPKNKPSDEVTVVISVKGQFAFLEQDRPNARADSQVLHAFSATFHPAPASVSAEPDVPADHGARLWGTSEYHQEKSLTGYYHVIQI
jgi:hypothetical protein